MGYFPFFVDLEGREGLVVGGGAVALRKLQKLLPYGPRLTVAAPELLAEIEALPGMTLRRTFAPAMLEGKGFVIAATDDREVNRGIAALCRERGIPVNAVDDKEQCTFLFPALVKRGDLTVGVSTAGASPSAAAWVGRRVSERLPEDFGELLDYLASLRPMVQKRVAAENRAAVFARLFSDCMEQGFPLEEAAEPAVQEDALDLLSAVRALPDKYSAVIHLYYYEGYSIKEIAKTLGLPAATVGTRLARGRERLRQMLREDVV